MIESLKLKRYISEYNQGMISRLIMDILKTVLHIQGAIMIESLKLKRYISDHNQEMKFCGCGDELRSEEDLKTNTCWICRSIGRTSKL